jgi:hypothetical protein
LALVSPQLRVRRALQVLDHTIPVYDYGGGALDQDVGFIQIKAMVDLTLRVGEHGEWRLEQFRVLDSSAEYASSRLAMVTA